MYLSPAEQIDRLSLGIAVRAAENVIDGLGGHGLGSIGSFDLEKAIEGEALSILASANDSDYQELSGLGDLNGFFSKIVSAVKKVVKAPVKLVQKVAKKVVPAIKKVASKVGQVVKKVAPVAAVGAALYYGAPYLLSKLTGGGAGAEEAMQVGQEMIPQVIAQNPAGYQQTAQQMMTQGMAQNGINASGNVGQSLVQNALDAFKAGQLSQANNMVLQSSQNAVQRDIAYRYPQVAQQAPQLMQPAPIVIHSGAQPPNAVQPKSEMSKMLPYLAIPAALLAVLALR